jgi:hypothetical protein
VVEAVRVFGASITGTSAFLSYSAPDAILPERYSGADGFALA